MGVVVWWTVESAPGQPAEENDAAEEEQGSKTTGPHHTQKKTKTNDGHGVRIGYERFWKRSRFIHEISRYDLIFNKRGSHTQQLSEWGEGLQQYS